MCIRESGVFIRYCAKIRAAQEYAKMLNLIIIAKRDQKLSKLKLYKLIRRCHLCNVEIESVESRERTDAFPVRVRVLSHFISHSSAVRWSLFAVRMFVLGFHISLGATTPPAALAREKASLLRAVMPYGAVPSARRSARVMTSPPSPGDRSSGPCH